MLFAIPNLVTAAHKRLTGADGLGHELTEPAYTRGAVPADAAAPYVLVEMPRSRPWNTLDSSGRRLRFELRAHTRFPEAQADRFEAFDLAEKVHASLSSAELTLPSGYLLHLPDPQLLPQPAYDAEGLVAYDVIARYELKVSE